MPRVKSENQDTVKVIVSDIKGDDHNRFAIAYLQDPDSLEGITPGESITFSLSDWSDKQPPECGQVVLVGGIRMFRRGWRAMSASPITPQTIADRK